MEEALQHTKTNQDNPSDTIDSESEAVYIEHPDRFISFFVYNFFNMFIGTFVNCFAPIVPLISKVN